ncbi:capsular biosynthesis protein [Sphingobium sp. AS12]|uniref:capsule biosynthesis protein n=1 Tax=Sphingobium sp. AS12 TaxID=2849495 RepID=UPI001C31DF4E|nr:capsular biosynthesis protein [Sphingobium sp. AS12]MBV2150008.1 capsular biosynthesis protein [Sphingobium sp. AS12]
MTERSFLFLQGPPGPFFSQLAAELRAAGHRCHRVNLNGGDWFDWRGTADNFTGTLEAWPAYLQRIIARELVTDIVLFGDCRQHHLEARACAAADGIAVHVFEEGYIRPDWVTLERTGVNGNSSLPRTPEVYRRLAPSLPSVPDHARVRPSFRQRATETFGYFLASLLLTACYRGYRSHRPYPIVAELYGWATRIVARPVARQRSAVALRRLGQRRYFLLPLQLDSDHQIRIHSPFTGMHDALRWILGSFAACAPADVVLLIKEHPLDNGLHAWRRTVVAMARELGIAERVLFIEHGDLYTIVGAAAGVVTVNSTTGTLALASGIPVAVLGTAIYDLPGVTHQGSLGDFWTAPSRPHRDLYDAFRRVLVARCLLHGGFSSSAGRALLLPRAVKRLQDEGVTPVCLSVSTMAAA